MRTRIKSILPEKYIFKSSTESGSDDDASLIICSEPKLKEISSLEAVAQIVANTVGLSIFLTPCTFYSLGILWGTLCMIFCAGLGLVGSIFLILSYSELPPDERNKKDFNYIDILTHILNKSSEKLEHPMTLLFFLFLVFFVVDTLSGPIGAFVIMKTYISDIIKFFSSEDHYTTMDVDYQIVYWIFAYVVSFIYILYRLFEIFHPPKNDDGDDSEILKKNPDLLTFFWYCGRRLKYYAGFFAVLGIMIAVISEFVTRLVNGHRISFDYNGTIASSNNKFSVVAAVFFTLCMSFFNQHILLMFTSKIKSNNMESKRWDQCKAVIYSQIIVIFMFLLTGILGLMICDESSEGDLTKGVPNSPLWVICRILSAIALLCSTIPDSVTTIFENSRGFKEIRNKGCFRYICCEKWKDNDSLKVKTFSTIFFYGLFPVAGYYLPCLSLVFQFFGSIIEPFIIYIVPSACVCFLYLMRKSKVQLWKKIGLICALIFFVVLGLAMIFYGIYLFSLSIIESQQKIHSIYSYI
jgi:hypothetical protein